MKKEDNDNLDSFGSLVSLDTLVSLVSLVSLDSLSTCRENNFSFGKAFFQNRLANQLILASLDRKLVNSLIFRNILLCFDHTLLGCLMSEN